MKTYIILALVSIGAFVNAQCPTGLTLTTQQEVDDFIVNYPTCTDIPGQLRFEGSGSDIVDISAFAQLESVGLLYIEDTDIDSISFPNLTATTSEIRIQFNNELLSISFPKVESIGSNMLIFANNNLTQLGTFDELTYIQGSLYFIGNDGLVNISGFQKLTTITNNYIVNANSQNLIINGFQNLESIGDNFHVRGINSISNTSFESLTSIGGDFGLLENTNITSLSPQLDNLSEINGNVDVTHNPLLSNCDLLCSLMHVFPFNKTITIFANNSGCDSQAEVDMACLNPCEETNLHINPIDQQVYNVDRDITSDATLLPNQSSTFNAGRTVELLPGFESNTGGIFEVVIIPCIE